MIPTIPEIEDLTQHEDIGPHPAGWIPGLPPFIPGLPGVPFPFDVPDVPGAIRRAVGVPDIDWPKIGRFAVVSGVLIVGLLGLIVPESGLSVDDLKGLFAKGAEVAA